MSIQVNRIFCMGRNYDQHIQELQSNTPKEPVIFMKPASSYVPPSHPITQPELGHTLHHEAEIVVQIGQMGRATSTQQALQMISAYGLGLDLTLRDKQNQFKKQGLPWEISKSFDGSAPCGHLSPWTDHTDPHAFEFQCLINDQLRQSGHGQDMRFSIAEIIVFICKWWTLQPNDLIYTGTPQGVGPIMAGDHIIVQGPQFKTSQWHVAL